ncbi:HEAT repeat domain-containing protein [Bacillus pinisoli]|uniref:HEAT repeat domain-containing protein n=1 Tax=Bacillus pinisoli TaxID=2901866 RepID=UPI001FF31DB3|nr:HEAT repeat domain-containing protein [Bacillus pinisoli]
MEQPIVFLLLLIIMIILILLVLFFYLTIRKAIENRSRLKIDLYKEDYRNHMFRYLYKGEHSRHLLPDNDMKYKALEELLNEFANVAEGEEFEARMRTFSELYFLERYKNLLFHRRWSKRMNVLYNIESFQLQVLLEDVVNLYNSRKTLSEAEVVQIFKLMVKFDHPDLYHYITANQYNLSEFVYRLLVSNMKETTLKYFIAKYDQLSTTLKLTIIDVLGIENRQDLTSFLRAQLTNNLPEIRIRSLKALANLAVPLTDNELKQHLYSKHFEERIMALKLAASVRKKEYLPYIIESMSDGMFSVRQQAAQAIYRYPNGLDILSDILTNSTDQFARDMAMEWLEKGRNNGASR